MTETTLRGYYLHSLNKNASSSDLAAYGVQKKINAQVKAFNNYFDCKEVICYQIDSSTAFNKIKSRLPFTAISEKWVYGDEYKDIDFIYFRKNIIDYSVVSFFRKIKKHNPKCKIVLEIPTYPYDKEEFKTLKDLPFKLKDRINRKRLHKYVDLITIYGSNETVVFNTPCLVLRNGVDFSDIPIKKAPFHDDRIDIVMIGMFSHWHGYERMLYGLSNYLKDNGKTLFHLHFVGDGVSIPEYKSITKQLSIDEYVTFYGALSGKELDEVFEKCDIGCDTLGSHRKDVHISSTLKTRDYAARGLPIIGSEKIDFIDESFEYFLKLEGNDNPVDYNSIEDFYNNISKEGLAIKVRNYALTRIDINSVIKPIVDFIGK